MPKQDVFNKEYELKLKLCKLIYEWNVVIQYFVKRSWKVAASHLRLHDSSPLANRNADSAAAAAHCDCYCELRPGCHCQCDCYNRNHDHPLVIQVWL